MNEYDEFPFVRASKQFINNMTAVKLYSYWRSSASWRVRTVLHWKGIAFEYVAVNLLQGEQSSEWYKQLNPMGLVPSLQFVETGQVVGQSIAITELLEEMYPQKPLLPTDLLERAKVRMIVDTIACDIHPVQNLRVLKYAGDERRTEWAKHFIETGFNALETMLSNTAGQYCVGDTVTLADVYLVPQVYNANRVGVDMNPFPTINAVHSRLVGLDAFQKAHPIQCQDATE